MADTIQKLIQARTEIQRGAFDNADVDKMMSLMSKDIVFTDKDFGIVNIPYPSVQEFYTGIFATTSSFQVLSSTATGTTPEFTAWELTTQSVASEDLPALKAKKGDTVRLNGVSLLWWRWEGEGKWDGDLSDRGVRGWKVWKQTDYFIPEVNPER